MAPEVIFHRLVQRDMNEIRRFYSAETSSRGNDKRELVHSLSPPFRSHSKESFRLAIPGAAASFKLYSLTADGNQRGSNAVTVGRLGTGWPTGLFAGIFLL